MATKLANDQLPETPPQSDQPPDAHAPDARTLPPSPPISPIHQQRQRRNTLDTGIDSVLQALVRHRRGPPPISKVEEALSLSQSQLVELEGRLQDEKPELWAFWNNKLRYDYYGAIQSGSLILRMPSAIHEEFTRSVEGAIEEELKALASRLSTYDERAMRETRRIKKSGSTTLEYTQPELVGSRRGNDESPVIIRHSPDASFKHPAAGWRAPGLVVEVSYSQKGEKLSRLAESYITNSEHRIRCVIALDIIYASPKDKGSRNDKSATLSVWRPVVIEPPDAPSVGCCKQDVDAVQFRDAKGQACSGALELSLADFLLPSVCKKISDTAIREHVSITFEKLTEFLDEADLDDQYQMPSEEDKPELFQKRKRSPSEELSDTREEEFAQLELADSAKESITDAAWRTSSRNKRQATEGSSGARVVEVRRSTRRRSSDREGTPS